jgi:ankyrin repeat protein
MQQLLKAGADVNAAEGNGSTALHLAVRNMAPAGAQSLAQHLRQTAASMVSVVQRLLAAGADVHATSGDGGYTPLHLAVHYQVIMASSGGCPDVWPLPSSGTVPVVQQLLAAGADINAADNLGSAALHAAGIHQDPSGQTADGMVKVVQQLLEVGAAVITADRYGRTALPLAVSHELPSGQAAGGLVSVMQQLLAAGADVTAADSHGSTPLHTAVQQQDVEQAAVVQVLLAARVDVNATDGNSKTPLHVAAAAGARSVKLLNGRFPIPAAGTAAVAEKLIQLLVTAGARVHAKDRKGMTRCMWQCQQC